MLSNMRISILISFVLLSLALSDARQRKKSRVRASRDSSSSSEELKSISNPEDYIVDINSEPGFVEAYDEFADNFVLEEPAPPAPKKSSWHKKAFSGSRRHKMSRRSKVHSKRRHSSHRGSKRRSKHDKKSRKHHKATKHDKRGRSMTKAKAKGRGLFGSIATHLGGLLGTGISKAEGMLRKLPFMDSVISTGSKMIKGLVSGGGGGLGFLTSFLPSGITDFVGSIKDKFISAAGAAVALDQGNRYMALLESKGYDFEDPEVVKMSNNMMDQAETWMGSFIE